MSFNKGVFSITLLLVFWSSLCVFGMSNPFKKENSEWEKYQFDEVTTGYQVDASFDNSLHIIKGREKIFFYNNSKVPVSELRLSLYLNYFKSTDSEFVKVLSENGKYHISDLKKSHFGFTVVDNVSANFNTVEFEYLKNKSILSLQLPFQVQPGESILVELDFVSKLPEYTVRTGFIHTFHCAEDVIPVLCYLDSEGNWSDTGSVMDGFRKEYGVYDFLLKIPKGFTAVGTGTRLDSEEGAFHYYAENVNDFDWVIWDSFVTLERNNITVYSFPEHTAVMKEELSLAVKVMDWFETIFGDFPYPEYCIIDLPFFAREFSGKSGATMTMAYVPELALLKNRTREVTPVIKGMTGTFFKNISGFSGAESSELIEGIGNYMVSVYCVEGTGNVEFEEPCFKTLNPEAIYDSFLDSYSPEKDGNKVFTLLKTLENDIGRETVLSVFKELIDSKTFKQATKFDYLDILSEKAGDNFKKLIALSQMSSFAPDAWIDSFKRHQITSAKGYAFEQNKQIFIGEVIPPGLIEYTVHFSKNDIPLNLSYEIAFSDGSVESGVFYAENDNQWITVKKDHSVELVSIHLDREYRVCIDSDLSNNHYDSYEQEIGKVTTAVLFLTMMEWISYVF